MILVLTDAFPIKAMDRQSRLFWPPEIFSGKVLRFSVILNVRSKSSMSLVIWSLESLSRFNFWKYVILLHLYLEFVDWLWQIIYMHFIYHGNYK